MITKQNKPLCQTFTFAPRDIDAATAFVESGLTQLGLPHNTALRNRLMVEEVLLDWRQEEGMEPSYTVALYRRFAQVCLTLRCAGKASDPTAQPSDENFGDGQTNRSVLGNLGLAPTWRYQNGVNVLCINQKRPARRGQLENVLIAVLLALALGGVGLLVPHAWRTGLTNILIEPLFNTFLGLFSCLVGPMMFLSVIWGMVNIGDTRQLGAIGSRLVIRFLLVSTLFGILCMGVALWFLRPALGGTQSGLEVMQSLVEMVLDIVPDNIIAPFASGNTLQILFMGVVVGAVMILLRDRVQVLVDAVEQANAIVQFLLGCLSAMLPFFIFLSVLRLIFQGVLAQSAVELLRMIALIAALTAVEIALEIFSLMRLGVSPAQAVKKLGAPLLIALSTASSSATIPAMLDCCRDELGVDQKLSGFTLPFGSVVFMPHEASLFIVAPLFAAELYGIELSPGSLVLCVINAVILSVATPPIPGGATSCFALMFLQLGIPLEAVSLATAANVVLDFTATAGDICDLLVQLTHGANRMGLLDINILRGQSARSNATKQEELE